MKSSAWYHKLWREKFSNIPIKESSDSAWSGMKNLLDQQMPVNVPVSGSSNVFLGTKLFKLIGYVLPVVATISIITYINLTVKKEDQIVNEKKKPIQLDSSNNANVNVEKFKDIQLNSLKDTPKIVDSNDNNINVRKNIDGVENSLTPNNRLYGYEKSKLSKGSKFTKTIRDRFLSIAPEFLQSNNAQIIDESISSTQQGKIIDKVGQDIEFTHSGYLIQRLSPTRLSIGDSSMSIKRSSIILPKRINSTIFFGSEKERKGQNKKEKHKLKAENNKNTNILKLKKIRGDHDNFKSNNEMKSGLQAKIAFPRYNYGIEAGSNLNKYGSSYYVGAFGKFVLKDKWLIGVGLNANSNQKISGEFSHPSYFRPDSLPPFIISDTRKLTVLDIPLKVGYRFSKTIALNAGTIISFPIKQSSVGTKLKPIADPRDTLYHSKEINFAMNNTTVNKINFGFTGGISIHIKRFDINGTYQWLNPYRVRNPLGFYDRKSGFFRVGIGYRFK